MAHKKSSVWLASLLERAYPLRPLHSHLYTLILVFRIVQALATLTAGLIVGLVYIWKVGLVGLGIFPHLSRWSLH